MRVGARIALWLCGLSALGGQSLPVVTIEPEVKALIAVKDRMRESLLEVPEFVCAQTVHRLHVNERQRRRLEKRWAKARATGANLRETTLADFTDVVRLEVAVVGGAELYSWPGDQFEPISPAELVGFGLMADGALFSLARSIFVTEQGVIRFAGVEELLGRPAVRYDYDVSYFRSGYTITTVSGSAKTAFRGSFWADRETLRLLRLSKEAVDLPPELGLTEATTVIDYQHVEIGERELTLPRLAVDELRMDNGAVSRNEATFEGCRHFGAASSLSFDVDETETPVAAPALRRALILPQGLKLRVRLAEAVRSETAVVGDAIVAELRGDVVEAGEVVAREGDVLRGRIRRLQPLGGEGDPYYAIALSFHELEGAEGTASLSAKLVDLQDTRGVSRSWQSKPRTEMSRRTHGYETYGGGIHRSASVEEVDRGIDGLDTFYVQGERWELPAGFGLTLEVVADN